jgi:hypothetical protein
VPTNEVRRVEKVPVISSHIYYCHDHIFFCRPFVPILLATVAGSIFSDEVGIPGPMIVPLLIGALYLVVGYEEK